MRRPTDQKGIIVPNLARLDERLAELERRVAALEGEQPQPLADAGWTVWMRIRESIVFMDAAGHVQMLPVAVVALLADGLPLDGSIREEEGTLVFVAGDGKEIGRVPKSLAVVLNRQHLLRNWTKEA